MKNSLPLKGKRKTIIKPRPESVLFNLVDKKGEQYANPVILRLTAKRVIAVTGYEVWCKEYYFQVFSYASEKDCKYTCPAKNLTVEDAINLFKKITS